MQTYWWFLLLGGVMLLVGLTSSQIRAAPVTSSIIYLLFGLIMGPTGFGLFHFNPLKQSGLFEVITEVAVLISLFAAGVKMPAPFSLAKWRAPLQLAFISVALTVGFIAAFGYWVLGLDIGVAVLLGAVLAPTDPVLATEIQLRQPGDNDRLRFTLTSEAGINDGSAFPFVMLGLGLMGLHDLGPAGSRWLAIDLVWATIGAIVIGAAAGWAVARLARSLKSKAGSEGLLFDFIGLGLIGFVYGSCVFANTWGFLGVFVAAVVLRHVEQRYSEARKLDNIQKNQPEGANKNDQVSDASLIFKEHLERLSEILLVVLIGGTLFVDSWSWPAVGLAAFVFFIARPLSVFIGLWGTREKPRVRNLCCWFGVRGIGSLYYLMYAIEHGVPESTSLQLIHFTLVVVSLSIFVHGGTVKPLLQRFWRTQLHTK